MWQGDSPFQPPFPQDYIVHPPVKAMRVPVLLDPAQSDAVLAILRAGTAVQVVGRTALWLEIKLPGGQHGFIQEAYARPATPEEALAAQAAGASGGRGKPQGPILSVEAGLVRPRRRASFGFAFSAFMLSFAACGLGVVLVSTATVAGEVLASGGFLVFCVAVVAWIITMVRTYRGRER